MKCDRTGPLLRPSDQVRQVSYGALKQVDRSRRHTAKQGRHWLARILLRKSGAAREIDADAGHWFTREQGK
jgi:hypothetical protein